MRSSSVRHLPYLVAALAVLACDLDSTGMPGNSGSNGDGGAWKQPTVEVTVAGTHFGPGAPSLSSSASLVNNYDSFSGRIQSSTFSVTASSTDTGASCAVAVFRQGDDVAPINVGTYQLSSDSFGATADGTVVPLSGESVTIPQGTWSCSGLSCDGGTLVLIEVDTAHVLGYITGTYSSNVGAAAQDVVCSFWVRWSDLRQ